MSSEASKATAVAAGLALLASLEGVPSGAKFRLQPGKYYRQRDGGKAYVAAELPEELVDVGNGLDAFVGIDDDGDQTSWDASGMYYSKSRRESDCDLLAEWTDEPTDAEIAEAVRWMFDGRKAVVYISGYRRNVRELVEAYHAGRD